MLDRHGAIRVDSMEALADAALAFASMPQGHGAAAHGRHALRGADAPTTDSAAEFGLRVDPWEPAGRDLLAAHLPYFGSTANPVDVTGSMINDIGIMTRTLEVVRGHDGTDAVLVVVGNADRGAAEVVDSVTAARAATSKPFFVAWTGGSGRPREALLATGVPVYPDPRRAVLALSHLVDHSLRTIQTGGASG